MTKQDPETAGAHSEEKSNVGITGAVMVVGGGIAGIQASLDIAEAGYKVYLCETKSAIGGHMAQLDKTFPTNDCAMCTISPKLGDVGRHLNIEILTNVDVLSVDGAAGNFDAKIRRRPRYIDLNKCTACGDCEKVCPVEIRDEYNEDLVKQRAAFKRYPQAVPNAYAIEKMGVSPCRDACPAGQRAQGYLAHIRNGDFDKAFWTIKLDNPFPSICGRACHRPCEDVCLRAKVDEAIDIRAMKRFATAKAYSKPYEKPNPAAVKFKERVAVVGASPSGLTAARDLCLNGYETVVFEAKDHPGGLLNNFKTVAEDTKREIQEIIDLGVSLKLDSPVRELDELFALGFNAVVVAGGNGDLEAYQREGLFSCGDRTNAKKIYIIDEIGAGHEASRRVAAFLRGEETPETKPKPVVADIPEEILKERVKLGKIKPQGRIGNSTAKKGVYSDEEAKLEASRCLECGICSECNACVEACQAGAVDHEMVGREETLKVGAVVMAPGYEVYDARFSQEYGFGRFKNVITSIQFERLLSASGPTQGHIERPSDGNNPKRIAFLQCTGSRDQKHDYCSSVCCMYAAKEAMMAIEHEPETKVTIFFMDTRSFSKGYNDYYERAKGKYGVRYERCRISRIIENPHTKNLQIRNIHNGKVKDEEFDLVVLSVGMEISAEVRKLAARLGIEVDASGFCKTDIFTPLQTSRPGIFVAGPFREPKDIPDTVIEASGTASKAATLLSSARGTLTKEAEFPLERDVSGEEPKIGVFVCHCGSNIAGFVDVNAVAEYARSLPGVVYAENTIYACAQNTVTHFTDLVREKGLNRVVLAACTPRTHEPLFQDAVKEAGLNPALFEMTNIRNQCSWVHSDDWAAATRKSMDLVRAAVMRAHTLKPVKALKFNIRKPVMIIGGGAAGMTAALELADQGFPVHLIEKTSELGGNLREIRYMHTGENPETLLIDLLRRIKEHENINVYLDTELTEIGGFQGNFTGALKKHDGRRTEIEYGAAIVAVGGQEYRGPEYELGSHPDIMTALDFEKFLHKKDQGTIDLEENDRALPSSVIMIQCVGPAEKFCSRICCVMAVKNAIKLKELNPEAKIIILYKDIRTYGFHERLYTKARELGVVFRRYNDGSKPKVAVKNDELRVVYKDAGNGKQYTLKPNLLILSEPVVSSEGAGDLARLLKVPRDADGFFLEAHIKLRPIDFQSNGLFMAGLAHYPKLLPESIAQAQAAAARAATILAKDNIKTAGIVAEVDAEKCAGCLTCVRVCPYAVPKMSAEYLGSGKIIGAAYIEPATCHGCGVCAGECPAKAIDLAHYADEQLIVAVKALACPGADYHEKQAKNAANEG